MARSLTLASGQLGSEAATLLSGASAPSSGRVDVLVHNTGTGTETVVFTFQVEGGTARRLWQVKLEEDQSARLSAIPMQPDDTLLAVTTNADVVDYLIFASAGGGLNLEVFSADGTNLAAVSLRKILFGIEQILGTEMLDPGT